jgi:hypothetical protein
LCSEFAINENHEQKEFHEAFETLTGKAKSVLMLMLFGKTDKR